MASSLSHRACDTIYARQLLRIKYSWFTAFFQLTINFTSQYDYQSCAWWHFCICRASWGEAMVRSHWSITLRLHAIVSHVYMRNFTYIAQWLQPKPVANKKLSVSFFCHMLIFLLLAFLLSCTNPSSLSLPANNPVHFLYCKTRLLFLKGMNTLLNKTIAVPLLSVGPVFPPQFLQSPQNVFNSLTVPKSLTYKNSQNIFFSLTNISNEISLFITVHQTRKDFTRHLIT